MPNNWAQHTSNPPLWTLETFAKIQGVFLNAKNQTLVEQFVETSINRPVSGWAFAHCGNSTLPRNCCRAWWPRCQSDADRRQSNNSQITNVQTESKTARDQISKTQTSAIKFPKFKLQRCRGPSPATKSKIPKMLRPKMKKQRHSIG